MASTILASRKLSWCPLLPYQERCFMRICWHCFLFHLHLHQHLYLWQFPCQYHPMRYIFINAWGIFFTCVPLNLLITHDKMHHFCQCMRVFSIPSYSQFVKSNWSHVFCAIYLIGHLDINFFFPSLGCFSCCFISSDMSTQFCWLCMLPSTWWAIFRYCKLYRYNERICAWLEQFKEWLYFIGSCTVVCSCWLWVCGSIII